MENKALANEIRSLQESMETLMQEIQWLRDDLEKSREHNDGLKFRLSELESALDR